MQSPFHDRMGNQLSWGEATHKIGFRLQSYRNELTTAMLWWLSFLPSHTLRRLFLRVVGVKIGKRSYIHSGCRVYEPGNITIGEGTIIGYNATLDGRDTLTIGNHVDIASEVMIYNAQHDIDSEDFGFISKPVQIGDFVFIGPRAVILPGVKVEKGAVVGAAAVVTQDVPARTVVGGNPAAKIRERNVKELKYRLGRARLFQ